MTFRCLPPLLFCWAVSAALGAVAALGAPKLDEIRVGLGDSLRLGSWAPVRITVAEPGAELLRVVVIAPDCEGTPMATSAELVHGQGELLIRVGRTPAELDVRLFAGHLRLDRRRITATPDESTLTGAIVGGKLDLSAANAPAPQGQPAAPVSLSQVSTLGQLPTSPLGYDSVETLVIAPSAGGEFAQLPADPDRYRALRRWLERGGRLVLAGGAEIAKVLTAENELTKLFACTAGESVPQFEFPELEEFAEADTALAIPAGVTVPIVRLTPQGATILAGTAELPLVTHARIGFGEALVVAVDLSAEPLGVWSGRRKLLRKLLALDHNHAAFGATSTGDALIEREAPELANLIHDQLDHAAAGQRTSFAAVFGGLTLYLLALGPACYWLVQRSGQPRTAWLLFPLVLGGAALVALGRGTAALSAPLRVSQLELIDIDALSGLARGTLFAQVATGQAERCNLRLAPHTTSRDASVMLAWHGATGEVLGAMNGGVEVAGQENLYEAVPTSGELRGAPLAAGASRRLRGEWLTKTTEIVSANLTATNDGIVIGSVTNDTSFNFERCRLVYGDWAWRVGQLSPGQTAELSDSPLKFRTLVERDDFGADPTQGLQRLTLDRLEVLTPLLLFTERLESLVRVPFHATRDRQLDFSSHLAAGRAVLIAETKEPWADLLRNSDPIPNAGSRPTVVRFVYAVAGER